MAEMIERRFASERGLSAGFLQVMSRLWLDLTGRSEESKRRSRYVAPLDLRL
jgi:hypothetical protein